MNRIGPGLGLLAVSLAVGCGSSNSDAAKSDAGTPVDAGTDGDAGVGTDAGPLEPTYGTATFTGGLKGVATVVADAERPPCTLGALCGDVTLEPLAFNISGGSNPSFEFVANDLPGSALEVGNFTAATASSTLCILVSGDGGPIWSTQTAFDLNITSTGPSATVSGAPFWPNPHGVLTCTLAPISGTAEDVNVSVTF